MKIAVISPETFVPRMQNIAPEFETIVFTYLTYHKYEEIEEIIVKARYHYDAFLFSGLLSYHAAKKYFHKNLICTVLPRYEGEILSALLKVSTMGHDINRVSFDTYLPESIAEAYREIGIPKKVPDLISMKGSYDDYHYNEMIYYFHKAAYDSGRTDICVTTHNEVASLLTEDGIPNIKSERTYDTIRLSIRNLQMKYLDMQKNQKHLAVIGIQTRMDSDYNTIANNEHQYITDRLRIMEQAYLTAQTLQAAVVEGLHDTIYLFTTREILERETKGYTHFQIADQLHHKIFTRLFMGIGLGSTMAEAKQNALLGMKRSEKYSIPSVFLVYDTNTMVGPIEFDRCNKEKGKENGHAVQPGLADVSEITKVSINQLTKIKSAMTKYSKNTFTSQELASICGISLRTMNRIIERLIDHKYAVISGKTVHSDAGRPRRILHFYI